MGSQKVSGIPVRQDFHSPNRPSATRVENARMMRWALFLMSYPMHIEAIKGVVNVGADFMSRASY